MHSRSHLTDRLTGNDRYRVSGEAIGNYNRPYFSPDKASSRGPYQKSGEKKVTYISPGDSSGSTYKSQLQHYTSRPRPKKIPLGLSSHSPDTLPFIHPPVHHPVNTPLSLPVTHLLAGAHIAHLSSEPTRRATNRLKYEI
jgi:hypothetical protein